MKQNKLLALVFVAMLSATYLYADPIDLILQVGYTDPTDPLPDNPRSPVLIPEFTQDGYTLTAGSNTVGSTVELLDEDENVVYTAYVYVEGDTIVLPATLSGTYAIRVTRDDNIFVGEIEL